MNEFKFDIDEQVLIRKNGIWSKVRVYSRSFDLIIKIPIYYVSKFKEWFPETSLRSVIEPNELLKEIL